MRLEFYHKDTLIAAVNSSAVPEKRAFVNILGKDWIVAHHSYSLDYSQDPVLRQMRCNVYLRPA